MKRINYARALLIGLGLVINGTAIAKDFLPQSDASIVERLAPRVLTRQAQAKGEVNGSTASLSENDSQETAKRWIQLSRQTSDPRYLGRAQSVLTKWWDRADAPADIAVLQATIEQSRHEFDKARASLLRVVRNAPNHAQAWLTIATLERLSANYPAAIVACEQVARSGNVFYGQACQFETLSLQGDFATARAGFDKLLNLNKGAPSGRGISADDQAWLWSLQAENEERAGKDASAMKAYATSLALANDGYTALAYADGLLRLAKPDQALKVLMNQPDSDAVLLRRAYAQKRLGDANWQGLNQQLKERFAALKLRGEETRLHARELALAAFWLDQQYGDAAALAMINLQMQKEPFDWWLALSSSQSAGLNNQVTKLKDSLMRSGLVDQRLSTWQVKAKP